MAGPLGAVSKTWALLLEPLRHINNKDFGCVVFRRTYPQVTNPGGMWDESMSIYPLLNAKSRESDLSHEFSSGAVIRFAHMQHEQNKNDWQGAQIALIEFDELPHFKRGQFFYMLSRNRSMCGIKPYVRATMNPVPPDDETGGWIHEFLSWYIDDEGWAIPERSGAIRWFVVINDALRWADSEAELRQQYPELEPKSFTFIKSSVYDNQKLLEKDPGYIANLMALPLVDRERLLGDKVRGGNWLVKPTAGKVFNKSWFEIVDAIPAGGRTVRFWDLAASEKKMAGDDPDFTASTKMTRVGDIYYIVDCTEEQMDPARTDKQMKATASQDGVNTEVRFEMEGGASGKRDRRYIVSMLAGYDVAGVRPQGDKIVRAKPLASQAEAGNVKLLRGAWNQRWLNHMHGQPDLAHDDIMDSSSGAFNILVKTRKEADQYKA
jgi:predicted phage terminase large subunit-like protein